MSKSYIYNHIATLLFSLFFFMQTEILWGTKRTCTNAKQCISNNLSRAILNKNVIVVSCNNVMF